MMIVNMKIFRLNETPEYLKKNSSKIFTPWNKESHEIFAKSLKYYLYPCCDRNPNDLITEDQHIRQLQIFMSQSFKYEM
jgi:hypothetical protein